MKCAQVRRGQFPLPADAARATEKHYAEHQGRAKREGRKMASKAMRRSAAALAVAATVVGVGASAALAQDYAGSSVTTAGDTTGVEVGDILILAPGVTISGGEVSNETGIGVVIGGGSSVGSTTGGDTNAAADG
jgi:hypothetical protein